MTWFLLALVAPFLYAITNHVDKALLSKYFKESGVGTLILFSSLLSVIAIPFILIADSSVLSVSMSGIFLLCIVGLLDVAILWFYLMALQGDEPSIIIIFYQLVPVFALILGYIILGESLAIEQLIAMAIIILGTTLVSFEFDDMNNIKLRKHTIIFMTMAALAWAIESVLFKFVALDENVWRSLFWEHLMLVFIGMFLLIAMRKYRSHFIAAIKYNSTPILSLNVANESLYMVGNITVAFAVMLAPVALVLLAEPFQAFFVFILGVFLTYFFPQIYNEKSSWRDLTQKLAAIIITGVGTYLLLSVT
ncbi:hypothetical protein CL653_02715 [bacterium]|nr:hypothetical protein [bacterium]